MPISPAGPKEARLAPVASPQSEPVPDRAWLEERFERFAGHERPIARPANWGGFRVVPATFEFWQGRPNRLHDRVRYDLTSIGWEIDTPRSIGMLDYGGTAWYSCNRRGAFV